MGDDTGPTRGDGGDRTRDHLANERTFLAWVRTALALIGMGFVVARMGLFLRELAMAGGERAGGPPGRGYLVVGIAFALIGTVLGGWAAWRYQSNRVAIEARRYRPAERSATALAAVVVVGGLVVLVMVARQAWLDRG